jgi:ribonuclease HII
MKRPRLTAFDRNCFGEETAAVVGVDEAGRGALAGPVVAAALLASRDFYESAACRRIRPSIRDSKVLPFDKREEAFRCLEKCRDQGGILYAPGVASVEEIAEENILGATRLAMKRALDTVLSIAGFSGRAWAQVDPGDLFYSEEEVSRIRTRPVILVDGRPLKPFFYPHTALVKGDGRSFAIAAASIVAKVTRDRLMQDYHREYPLYGFDAHKGYGTPRHLEGLEKYGTCPLHREKFLRKLIAAGVTDDSGELFDLEAKV